MVKVLFDGEIVLLYNNTERKGDMYVFGADLDLG